MEYHTLGKTNIRVSIVALGCAAFGGIGGVQEDTDSIATVHAALDVGVNYFDTAEDYGQGRSEEVLGRALAGRRQQAVIASKVGVSNFAPEDLVEACERSLRYLGTDYIDLYQMHWPSRLVDVTVPLADTWGTLEKLRDQGKVRALGVCSFGVGDLADLSTIGHAETDQLPYNLLWRAIEYGIRDACEQRGIGILCYFPLMHGLLTGKFTAARVVEASRVRTRHFSKVRKGTRHGEDGCEEATFAAIERIRAISTRLGQPMACVSLAWVLAQPAVTAVLVGARRPGQLKQNVDAAELTLTPAVIAELSQATDEVKRLLGPNPDTHESSARSRYR